MTFVTSFPGGGASILGNTQNRFPIYNIGEVRISPNTNLKILITEVIKSVVQMYSEQQHTYYIGFYNNNGINMFHMFLYGTKVADLDENGIPAFGFGFFGGWASIQSFNIYMFVIIDHVVTVKKAALTEEIV